MEGFPFVRRQEVVFRDLDAMGHVNHATLVTYLETARLEYFASVLGAERSADIPLILANVTVDFRSQASWREVLEVGTRVARVGTKSFVVEQEVRGPDGRLVLEASAVQVAFDYARNEAVEVPETLRAALAPSPA